MSKKICSKCKGKGFIEKYKRDGGKCFDCGGTGFTGKARKNKEDERPVKADKDGKKPLSNKGYSNLMTDDLLRVDPSTITNVADMKAFRTALKKKADELGIDYKYATPTRTLITAIQEKLNRK